MKKQIQMGSQKMYETPPAGDMRFLKDHDQIYVNVNDLLATMHGAIELMDVLNPDESKMLHSFSDMLSGVLLNEEEDGTEN